MELPANKSSHSRLTKHSFGVDKGEGFLYYVMMDRLAALPLRLLIQLQEKNLFLEFYTAKLFIYSLQVFRSFIQIPKK